MVHCVRAAKEVDELLQKQLGFIIGTSRMPLYDDSGDGFDSDEDEDLQAVMGNQMVRAVHEKFVVRHAADHAWCLRL